MSSPLYARVMGQQFENLGTVLQTFHSCEGEIMAFGHLNVEGATTGLGKLITRLGNLPRAERQVPVRLKVTTTAWGEYWERWFHTKRLVSRQHEWRGLLLESIGIWTIGFELVLKNHGMRFVQRRVWFLGIPWMVRYAPQIEAHVIPAEEGWNVDVRIALPFIGQLIRYQGGMKPL